MFLKNEMNLPQEFVDAVTFQKPCQEIIRVTSLIDSPRIRQLRIRHWESLSEDVSERVWALLGQAVHLLLAQKERPDSFVEERLKMKIGGKTVSGQSDLLRGTHLDDWKVTSAWTVVFNPAGREEWKHQVNVYRKLWNINAFDVKTMRIITILRDWTRNKALSDHNYPQLPIQTFDIPIMDNMDEYIEKRVELHKQAESLGDDDLPVCTDEERWISKSNWAVMKEGRKSAVRSKDTEAEAQAYFESMSDKDKGKCKVVERKGGFKRCMLKNGFCPVRAACKFAVEG